MRLYRGYKHQVIAYITIILGAWVCKPWHGLPFFLFPCINSNRLLSVCLSPWTGWEIMQRKMWTESKFWRQFFCCLASLSFGRIAGLNDVCGKNNNYNNSSGGYCNKSSEVAAAGAGNWPIATLNVGTTTTTN